MYNLNQINTNINESFVNISSIYYINDIYTNGFFTNYLYILGYLAIIFSILVITSKNPIISVLYLIALFLTISSYLIMSGLVFIGISYLLVYIGAISMLFLFILMLIDIRISELQVNTKNSIFLSFLIGSIFIYILSKIINIEILETDIYFTSFNNWEGFITNRIDIMSIGNVLYTNYSIWIIITSILLLLAMVGAIVINI
jgi:NADH-ubiquinone oxidoreductase chain 6